MLRASYPAMLSVAEAILKNVRSKKVDSAMMPTKNVITMIKDPARRAMLSVKRGEEEDKPEAKSACTGDAEAKPAKTKVEPKAFLSFIRAMGVNFFAGLPNSSPLTLAHPSGPSPLAPRPCPLPPPLPLPPPPHPIPTPHPMPCATP